MDASRALRAYSIAAVGAAMLSCSEISEPDFVVPQLSGLFSRIDGYATYVPGDNVMLTLTASDDQELTWVGFGFGAVGLAMRDSFPVSGRSATVEKTISVPRAWIGTAALHAFARDEAGHIVHVVLDTVTVIDARRRAMANVSLPAPVRDLVIDSARNLVYLSIPAAQQVAILDLATQQLRAPIQLFGSPWGLDLTPSRDSLVVALRRTHALAFVNLSTRIVDTVHLDITTDLFNLGPGTLRVMQNGKIVLATTFDGSGYAADIREFDLNTRTARTREDAFLHGRATNFVPVARSSDRTRLVALNGNSCCPADAVVYTAATDEFTAEQPTVDRFYPAVSVDAKGNRFLIDDVVFDSALRFVVRLGPQTVDSLRNWATVISPDGTHAYIARDQSYKKVRIDDVVDVELVMIPVTPYFLLVTPRGDLLIAVSSDAKGEDVRLWLIDLR